jgi:5'-3' exonuclease
MALETSTDRLMLLDTAGIYFRAFYGVPDTVTAPDGTVVNAVRGTLDIVARLVAQFEPTQLIACWDDDWRPQWRVDLIPTYKTHRVAVEVEVGPDVEVVPDPLSLQVPLIAEALGLLGIPIVGASEHEADDVIGTLASTASAPVDVVTGDRDLFQLVDDARAVRVIYTGRGMANLEILDGAAIEAKYAITPTQYAAFAAMRGDPSDGLPGVAGVGEKTAAGLLREFGDLDGIIAAAADAGTPLSPSVRAKLLAASDYLAVAPTVVNVVRDLALPEVDATIRPLSADQVDAAHAFSALWGLDSAMTRILAALPTA